MSEYQDVEMHHIRHLRRTKNKKPFETTICTDKAKANPGTHVKCVEYRTIHQGESTTTEESWVVFKNE